MTVWIVLLEVRNDSPGIEGVFLMEAAARKRQLKTIDELKEDNRTVYMDPRDGIVNEHWDYDVIVNCYEVEDACDWELKG